MAHARKDFGYLDLEWGSNFNTLVRQQGFMQVEAGDVGCVVGTEVVDNLAVYRKL